MKRLRGFTLVELITVIVIIGIVAMMVVNMITTPMEGYRDMQRRAELVDIVDITLQRMARDIHHSLPNSVRLKDTDSDGNNDHIEILHTIDGGRYAATGADAFDTTQVTSKFTILKKLNDTTTSAVQSSTHYVVVYNLGESGADAYSYGDVDNIDNMSPIIAPFISDTEINYSAVQFPFSSPDHRFMIVDKAMTFGCAGSSLYLKQGYAITDSIPTVTSADNLLADHVSSCEFHYNPGTTTRPGLVTLELSIMESGERISLLHQIFVENQP
jgi:MSHA biogenesis protein MshO